MSSADKIIYSRQFWTDNVEKTLEVRKKMGWKISERDFRYFVLPLRVNNELLDEFRTVWADSLCNRVKGMTMEQAAPLGDLFVTVTGCDDVITEKHFALMKDGAILCNAGHFDCEVDVAWLEASAVSKVPARENIKAYKLASGKTLYVIAEGRLVNLAAGDGHPAEIMDMSFAIQALSAKYLADNRTETRDRGDMLLNVPEEIDQAVAMRKLAAWGISIDVLTEKQRLYLYGK